MTHYEVLGIPEGASAEHIKSSYRLKMREYHPDLFQDQPAWVKLQAESEAKKINAAYEVLGDEGKRRQYDFDLAYNRSAHRTSAPPPRPKPAEPKAEPKRYCTKCGTETKDYLGNGWCAKCNTPEPVPEYKQRLFWSNTPLWGKMCFLFGAAVVVICTIAEIVNETTLQNKTPIAVVQQTQAVCKPGQTIFDTDTVKGCVGEVKPAPKPEAPKPEAPQGVVQVGDSGKHQEQVIADRCETAGYRRDDIHCIVEAKLGAIPPITVLHARANGYEDLVKQKETYCSLDGTSLYANWQFYCASSFVFADDYDDFIKHNIKHCDNNPQDIRCGYLNSQTHMWTGCPNARDNCVISKITKPEPKTEVETQHDVTTPTGHMDCTATLFSDTNNGQPIHVEVYKGEAVTVLETRESSSSMNYDWTKVRTSTGAEGWAICF